MKKTHYDITICTQSDCMCTRTKSCQRHISHYDGEQLVFQSCCMFFPDKEGCETFLRTKPSPEF